MFIATSFLGLYRETPIWFWRSGSVAAMCLLLHSSQPFMVLDPSETLLLPVPGFKKPLQETCKHLVWVLWPDGGHFGFDEDLFTDRDSPLQRGSQEDIWEGAVVIWTESRFFRRETMTFPNLFLFKIRVFMCARVGLINCNWIGPWEQITEEKEDFTRFFIPERWERPVVINFKFSECLDLADLTLIQC